MTLKRRAYGMRLAASAATVVGAMLLVAGNGILPWMAAVGALFVILGFVLWRNVKAREKVMNLGSKKSHSN